MNYKKALIISLLTCFILILIFFSISNKEKIDTSEPIILEDEFVELELDLSFIIEKLSEQKSVDLVFLENENKSYSINNTKELVKLFDEQKWKLIAKTPLSIWSPYTVISYEINYKPTQIFFDKNSSLVAVKHNRTINIYKTTDVVIKNIDEYLKRSVN